MYIYVEYHNETILYPDFKINFKKFNIGIFPM